MTRAEPKWYNTQVNRKRNSISAAVCPLCGGNDNSVIGKTLVDNAASAFVRNDYDILECRDCRFYFVYPVIDLTQSEWNTLYSNEYFGKISPWQVKSRQRDRKKRLRWLRETFDGVIHDFLDIGCGEGNVLSDAFRQGWNAVGIDIADNRIPEARADGIEFRKGNLFDVAFPDCSFDGIYMDSVLEHVLEPVRMIKEIRRILRPGGVLYVGVPNEDSLLNDSRIFLYALTGRRKISTRIKPFKRPYHVIGFTKRSLKSIFEVNGFEFKRFRNFAGPWEWAKSCPFSRPFFLHFALLPAYLISIPLRKMIYYDAILKKASPRVL